MKEKGYRAVFPRELGAFARLLGPESAPAKAIVEMSERTLRGEFSLCLGREQEFIVIDPRNPPEFVSEEIKGLCAEVAEALDRCKKAERTGEQCSDQQKTE